MTAPVLTPADTRRLREINDRRFRGWSAERVIRLHRQTADRDSDGGAAYVAGIQAHLASGLYRALYPPHVVEATRLFVARRHGRR